MSRKHSHARKRRLIEDELREEAIAARAEWPERFWGMLTRLSRSDRVVWDVARVLGEPLHEDEVAMIMLAAAPHLAEKTSGSVKKRLAEAERRTRSDQTTIKP